MREAISHQGARRVISTTTINGD